MSNAGSDLYKDIEGIIYTIEYKDTEAVQKITIDYDKLDYDMAKEVPGISLIGDTSKGISLEKSEKLVESSGYSKKENK